MELLLFAVAFLSLHVVDGSYNVSVDDSDGQISYSGSDWEGSSLHPSNLDFGGGHSVSTNPGDTATLMFTGVDVYYLSPLWPYNVSVDIAVDSGTPDFVNLLDPSYAGHESPAGNAETVAYQVMWQATGLANGTHQVVVSMPPGGQFVVVDGFYYTVLNTTLLASTSSTITSSTKTTAIAVGVGAGSAFIIICAIAMWLCYRRGQRRRTELQMPFTDSHDPHGSLGTQNLAAAPIAVPRNRLKRSERARNSHISDSILSSSASSAYNAHGSSATPTFITTPVTAPRSRLQRPERGWNSNATTGNISSLASGAHDIYGTPLTAPRTRLQRSDPSRSSYATTSDISSSASRANYNSPPPVPLSHFEPLPTHDVPRPRPQRSEPSRSSYATTSDIPSSVNRGNVNSSPSMPLSHFEPLPPHEMSGFSQASTSNAVIRPGTYNSVPPSQSGGSHSRIAPPSTLTYDSGPNQTFASSVAEKQALALSLYSNPTATQHQPRAPYQGNLSSVRESGVASRPFDPYAPSATDGRAGDNDDDFHGSQLYLPGGSGKSPPKYGS